MVGDVVAAPRVPVEGHVAEGVDGAQREEEGDDSQEEEAEGVRPQGAAPLGRWRCEKDPRHQSGLQDARREEGRTADGAGGQEPREDADGRGDRHERGEDHGSSSFSDVRAPTSMWSKVLWMLYTTIPMTKTPTKTSSSMPISTMRGMRFRRVRPKRKMPFSSTR